MIEVRRNQRFSIVFENTFQLAFGSGFHDRVHFFNTGIADALKVRSTTETLMVGNPNGKTVQFAIQLRQDETHSGCSARFGRDDVQGGGTGTSRTL